MKLIIGIIPTYRMESVIEELDKVHVFRKTVSSVLGIGQTHTEVYRGVTETGNLVKQVRFEIAVNDAMVESVIRALSCWSDEGESDGKIFILPLEECIQIGTGKRGSEAVGQ